GVLLAREAARDDLRDAVAAHRDAVEDVRRLHGALLVRDHDELGPVGVAAEQLDEPRDVGIVERGLDLVEEGERARVGEEEREEDRDRAERLLAAREQRQPRDLLARGPQLDLDPGLHAGAVLVVRIHDPQTAVAAGAASDTRRPPPGNSVAATSSKFAATAANVSSKRRLTVSVSSSRSAASSASVASRSARWIASSSRRSFSASYSSLASGLTFPSASRRDSSLVTRAASSSRSTASSSSSDGSA